MLHSNHILILVQGKKKKKKKEERTKGLKKKEERDIIPIFSFLTPILIEIVFLFFTIILFEGSQWLQIMKPELRFHSAFLVLQLDCHPTFSFEVKR